jgi:hypothetical protein
VSPSTPLSERVANLEMTLEGEGQTGALSARLERILTKLLPNGVYSTPIQIPAGTVFKAVFAQTLTVRNVAVGDIVELNVTEDCLISGTLAVARGDRVFAQVTKVKMPRSFGRTSEIGVGFNEVESIGGQRTAVTMGELAKKAMKVDSGTVGAVGTSLVGAVLIGPIGLAGGFLVKGSDKQIPAGSAVYVETIEASNVSGYTVGGNRSAEESPAGPSSDTPDFVPVDDSGQAAPPGDTF